jgi:STE24 endopeptidase
LPGLIFPAAAGKFPRMLELLVLLTIVMGATQPELHQFPRPDPSVVGVEAATQAYLDTVPIEQRMRSDAYFEGGYWLILWRFLWASAAMLVLLHVGLSARLRDVAERITGRVYLQPALYWVGLSIFAFIFVLPLAIYADFIREHHYGFSTQPFGAWMVDSLKALAVELVLGAFGTIVFYAALRKAGRAWWIWGAGVAVAFWGFTATIAPVYVEPLFNTYQPLRDPEIRDEILAMARANGIEATQVWEMDASRQTTRISANVSGLFGTERITLNDNLLNRTSRDAVLAVMGHEIGHYVLNHAYEQLLSFGLLIVVGFAAIGWAFPALAARYARRWQIRGIDDPAGLPLIVLLFGAYLFLVTPVSNSIVRSNEFEADVFGLNAARQPDGFAEAALLLGDYRKLHPGKFEEMIFFTHPSGYVRISTAMQWKVAQQQGR